MLIKKELKIDGRKIEAFCIKLLAKNFILLKGTRGYVMCGYLNLRVAEKFGEVAVKIVGVSSIAEAFKATVAGCTSAARKKGVYPGQPIREVLKIIA
jgi:uncharacterized protein YunC (DUF1805 family)